MTSNYLTSITPDSFSGLVFSFEGIKNAVVLMNGPTGCKFYHSATSDHQTYRQLEFDPLNYPELWYFGQPRVPCTYLDKRDYVYGSQDKLTDALRFLKENIHFELIVIVNSPGEALIGDDLKRIVAMELSDTPVVTVETPGYSRYIWDGYKEACKAIFDQLPIGLTNPAEKKVNTGDVSNENAKDRNAEQISENSSSGRKKVNLLGLTIHHKYYEGDKREWTRLLNLCGIDVNCALCCECTLDEIMRLPEADLNVVLDPSYGLSVAEMMKDRFHMPYVTLEGQPIGFKSTELLMSRICSALGCDGSAFVVESEKTRARAYIHISRINSLTGLPKGAKFAVHGTPAQCAGYTEFLVHYFGMVADSVSLLGEDTDVSYLSDLLKRAGMEGTLDKDILHTDAQIVFADGNIIAKLKARHHEFSGIETGLPSLGYNDVIPKTHMGLYGGLLICEEIINGLMF